MRRLFLIGIAMALLSPAVLAQTWTEVGDAGELVGNHQTTVGSGPLTSIFGSLTVASDPIDMYCIDIVDPQLFSATSSSPQTPLWLFDASANGVTSQEGFYLNTPSMITGAFVQGPGTYYLAISMHDTLPYNPTPLEIWNTSPRSVETAPNGAGAPGPLDSWDAFGAVLGAGPYTITLTGATYCVVPEPASLACLCGLIGLGLNPRRRSRRR